MWEFLIGMFIGDSVAQSRAGRFIRPLLALCVVGLLLAAGIYTAAVLSAVSERSGASHVHPHSTR